MPLIRLFLDICLFQKGPQDTPASVFLLGLTVAANFIVGAVLLALEVDWEAALIQAVSEMLILGGFVWGALTIGKKMPRFVQTAIATYGCDTLISAIAVPILAVLVMVPEARGIIGVLFLVITVWHLAVIGNIWRLGLSISFPAGFILALLYMATTYEIMSGLFQRLE